MANKPNIIIIYSDQHNARTLGCYGNTEVFTPNLDALARDGVRFENAYTQNPICTPSRMCLFSGQYVHNFGYYGLMGKNPVALPNMFEYVRRFGYLTGMAGKTHTPTGWLGNHCDFLADGYGYETPKGMHTRHLFDGLQGVKTDEYTIFLAERNMLHLRDDKKLPEFKSGSGQGCDARPSKLDENHTIEAWTAARINDFIDSATGENKPFCLWMTVPKPHQTYTPAQKFWNMYDEDSLTLPPNAGDDMKNRHASAQKTQKAFQENNGWCCFEPKDFESARKRVLHGYYANVTQVDDAAGRVIRHIDELGIRENTIIVYMSDHGEFAGEHGMIEKAPGISFRCCTRIPLIISWKGHLKTGETRVNLAESVDVFPTLCALAGIGTPDWTDGIDISALLETDCELKKIAVTENAYTKTLHTLRWKFTQYVPQTNCNAEFGELYDLANDPWELQNLYFDGKYAAVVNSLRYELYVWLVSTQRNVTVNPSIMNSKGFESDWDIGGEFYAEDGKIKQSFMENLIRNGSFNYL